RADRLRHVAVARAARSQLLAQFPRALWLRRAPRAARRVAARGLGGRGAGLCAAGERSRPALPGPAAHGADVRPDGGGRGACAVRDPRPGPLRALRPAGRGTPLLPPGAATTRGHLRDRALAQPVSGVRPAPHTAGAGERTYLGTLGRTLPAPR